MSDFIWLVRREFWENKAIWVMPACIGCLMVVASLFGKVEIAMLHASDEQSEVAGVLFMAAIGGVFWVAMSIYSVWYLLDCLYADRKDRSVLFFKSMPLTDSATVLSKLFVGVVAIPLVYFGVADVAALLMAFVISVRARLVFGNVLWRPELWLQVQALWLYVIATGVLWYSPVVGWLVLVSAWAGARSFCRHCCRRSRSCSPSGCSSALTSRPSCSEIGFSAAATHRSIIRSTGRSRKER